MSKYTEEGVLKILNGINGINVDNKSKVIELHKDAMIGNSVWGKIDYLTKYCDYTSLRSTGEKKVKDSKKSKPSKPSKKTENKTNKSAKK